uniref:Uncharacterized protein n=1 Tax=Romanomermis culicivorax TaxID=13658 RepID=A0A915KLZ9_ROMCU
MRKQENNKTGLLYKKQREINGDGDSGCPMWNVGGIDGCRSGHSGHRDSSRCNGEEGRGDYRSDCHISLTVSGMGTAMTVRLAPAAGR